MNPSDRVRKLPLTQRGIVLELRRRSRIVDFICGGIDGFVRHRTSRHAALLAHYGFLSVFPLIVVMTTILGFVLESRPSLRRDIVDSALAKLPIVGETLRSDPGRLHGNVAVLIIGLATTLWAGTRAFVSAQNGMNDIWEVPEHERPNLARTRGRALLAIGIVGLAQVGTAFVTGIVGLSGVSWLNRILLVLAATAINIGVVMASYRVLTARPLTRAQLLPGACAAGIGFSVLQVIGVALVGRAVTRASAVYGTFAAVIGLLAWLNLHAIVALFGVESNAALDHRRTSTDPRP